MTWTRWRVPLGFALGGAYLLAGKPTCPAALGWGLGLVVAGCALRVWAAGYLLKGKRVASGGPYAFVRNPLYVGSFLIGLGCLIAVTDWPLGVGVAVLWGVFLFGFVILYGAKTRAEERELVSALGEDYRRYAERVPAFVPWRGHIPGLPTQRFSSELYRRNREYQCLLGSAAVSAFLVFRYFHA